MKQACVWPLLVLFSASVFAKKEPPRTPEQLSADHGYVRVSLPQWEFASEFALLDLKSKKEAVQPRLQDRSGARSFAGWLPAGEYRVVGMEASPGAVYPPIVVRAGELTDLGVLLRVPIGGYEYLVVPTVDGEVERECATVASQLGALLKSPEFIRWRPGVLPRPTMFSDKSANLGLIADLLIAHDRKVNKPPLSKRLREARTIDEFLALAKTTLAPRGDEAGADGNGNLYYGADLGQIRVRRSEGSWDSLDTASLTEITAVEVTGTRLVAGDLRGVLRVSDDHGKTWAKAHGFADSQAILDIDRIDSRWLILAADFIDAPPPVGFVATAPGTPRGWTLGARLYVYSGVKDDFTDLAPIREVALQQPGFSVATVGFTRIRGLTDTYAGHAAGGFYFLSTLKNVSRMDLATLQWSEHDAGHRVDSIRISRDAKLITAKRLQGAFSKVSVSSDYGLTWIPYSRPPYVLYDVALETPESGESTRWNAGLFSAAIEFYAYDSKVKDWRKTFGTPEGCVQLLRDAEYQQRYCLTNGGSILGRQGDTWVAEFALE
jgi:hypothetical protein